MDFDKFRIRFRKVGDLRLLSHHDLMRTFERMLRRAGLPFRSTEGFHPKPRMVFASMVFCLTSSDLAVCSASVPCCSRVLIGTNFASGRTAAVQIAAASAASFFLPFLTNGLTASEGISFTSWPRPVSVRPQ